MVITPGLVQAMDVSKSSAEDMLRCIDQLRLFTYPEPKHIHIRSSSATVRLTIVDHKKGRAGFVAASWHQRCRVEMHV